MAETFKEIETQESLISKVYKSIGHASVCWTGSPTGVFDEKEATKVANDLLGFIEKRQVTHLQIANNSKGFRSWLKDKKIEFTRNGNFTVIDSKYDIFNLGYEFALYKQAEENKKIKYGTDFHRN